MYAHDRPILTSIAMKLYTTLLSVIISLTVTTVWAQSDTLQHFGVPITEDGTVSGTELMHTIAQKGVATAKVSGEVAQVCAVKGCWMTMHIDGQEMMVRFKDYGFFVPKNAAGKIAVVQGQAKLDTVDVATLRHYALDAGQSEAEIQAITEPEVKLSFEADGVILHD